VPATNGKYSKVVLYQVTAVWTFVGGVSDIFITCMLWFILDFNSSPVIQRHGDRVYPILDVVRERSSTINYEIETDQVEVEEASFYRSDSMTGSRMIKLFFQEVEGPDRDWMEEDYEPYEEEYVLYESN